MRHRTGEMRLGYRIIRVAAWRLPLPKCWCGANNEKSQWSNEFKLFTIVFSGAYSLFPYIRIYTRRRRIPWSPPTFAQNSTAQPHVARSCCEFLKLGFYFEQEEKEDGGELRIHTFVPCQMQSACRENCRNRKRSRLLFAADFSFWIIFCCCWVVSVGAKLSFTESSI